MFPDSVYTVTALSRIKIDMQITNSVVCGRSKGCIYKQIKALLVGEHAFPLTGFVSIGPTLQMVARPELPYPCVSQAKSRDETVVCGRSKGCIYKQIKAPLVGEHAFPLTGFVCKEAHVTNVGQTGVALPMRFPGQISGRDGSLW